jgi:Zn finger protein HypA/HybF involved in hydrogenase expression
MESWDEEKVREWVRTLPFRECDWASRAVTRARIDGFLLAKANLKEMATLVFGTDLHSKTVFIEAVKKERKKPPVAPLWTATRCRKCDYPLSSTVFELEPGLFVCTECDTAQTDTKTCAALWEERKASGKVWFIPTAAHETANQLIERARTTRCTCAHLLVETLRRDGTCSQCHKEFFGDSLLVNAILKEHRGTITSVAEEKARRRRQSAFL